MASDSVPLTRTIPTRKRSQEDMTRARLRLGPDAHPARFQPSERRLRQQRLRHGGERGGRLDVHRLRAGATFLIPFGSKFVLRADAFPQYTWYKELTERDQFGGRYKGSIYGFFNRMCVEVAGGYFQQYQQYSSEIDTQVFQRTTHRDGQGRRGADISSLALRAGA